MPHNAHTRTHTKLYTKHTSTHTQNPLLLLEVSLLHISHVKTVAAVGKRVTLNLSYTVPTYHVIFSIDSLS